MPHKYVSGCVLTKLGHAKYKCFTVPKFFTHILRNIFFLKFYIFHVGLTNVPVFQIITRLSSLLSALVAMWEEGSPSHQCSPVCCRLLLQCTPLLQQYNQILEYYMLHLLACLRASGKMLAVLLALFTELALKVHESFHLFLWYFTSQFTIFLSCRVDPGSLVWSIWFVYCNTTGPYYT